MRRATETETDHICPRNTRSDNMFLLEDLKLGGSAPDSPRQTHNLSEAAGGADAAQDAGLQAMHVVGRAPTSASARRRMLDGQSARTMAEGLAGVLER
jgi:hypothetical protein